MKTEVLRLTPQADSISRRLIDRYLMVGLACVFGSVSLAIGLAWRDALLEFAAVMAAVPLLVLLAGTLLLRRTLRLNDLIEEQLNQVGAGASSAGTALRPLPDHAPVAVGWNKLLHHLQEQNAVVALESRLGETLRTSDARRWETVFNTVSDGLAVADKQGRVVLANNAFWVLVGVEADRPPQERVAATLVSAAAPATNPLIVESLRENGGVLTAELRKGAYLTDGVLRLSRTPLIGDALDSGSSLWTLRDVTAQKLADEMRNQFVFTATHELRTPLTNIRAYAETLADNDGIDMEQQKRFYNIIDSEAARLGRLIDQLLNVSQMEAGSISIARHETDIERLVQEVIEHLQPQVQQKGLRFESRLPPKLPKLHVDKDKISAALVNLLGNAIKYTPEGGQVRLVVEADAMALHLRVEDTGMGIAPDELSRIGEKFFRSRDDRVRCIEGSGLGLAFSQEVARLHGGEITITSVLNQGSQFTFTLPLS